MSELPAMRGERLHGMLSEDKEYCEWYHRSIKGKPICGQILGRLIMGESDTITHEEEIRLWSYYEENRSALYTSQISSADPPPTLRSAVDKYLSSKKNDSRKKTKNHRKASKNYIRISERCKVGKSLQPNGILKYFCDRG